MATTSRPPSSSLDISDNVVELKSASIDVVGEHDLLIVGPGVLGSIVARQWQQEYPDCQIYGQTMTTDHHDELINYPNDLRLSTSNWSGEGSFLFTSSPAVYDCSNNGLCNEDYPLVPIGRSPRTDVLLKLKTPFLRQESDKGPHVYWLEKGTVESRPDHILNVIHYEDAATLSVAILKKKLQNRVFVGCDNHPVSRQDIMDAVSQSGEFSKKFNGFTGTDDPLGKKIYNPKTRSEIGWEPKYPSFRQFLRLTD
ncbi:hypothetical protein J5N97_008948 [Dioscorea zingiberensis]|uniref:Uncharacterized protein n=1 Tax=Dioscorea zingiberensis TaxID=325984 RepID=A0A9D5CYE5_9LILI|nr:hypothetical protein J5N97_008948 [Dioscorea zingiberensis]